MKLTTEKNGTDLTVILSGEINTVTAPELSGLLDRELGSVQNLILDFSDCDYVSSAGLRVLLAAYKKLRASNGTMLLTNVGDNFMDVLHNTQLDNVFDIR